MPLFEQPSQFDFIDEWRDDAVRRILIEFDELAEVARKKGLKTGALEAWRDMKIIEVEKTVLTQKFIAAAVARRLQEVWSQG